MDHINLADCSAAGVPVGHTPDVLSEDVADFAWALLLARDSCTPAGAAAAAAAAAPIQHCAIRTMVGCQSSYRRG